MLDPVKLDWMNGEYIKNLPHAELHDRLSVYLKEYASDFYENIFSKAEFTLNSKIINELSLRMKRFEEYIELSKIFYTSEVDVRKDLLVNPKMKIETEEDALESLQLAYTVLENAHFTNLDTIKTPLLEAISEVGQKNGQVLWPLRVALSGEEFSPGSFEMAYILGKEASLERIKKYF